MIARAIGISLCLAFLGGCARPYDNFVHTIDSHASATAALEEWCGRRGIMASARIDADQLTDAAPDQASPAIRAALGVTAAEPVRFRHVRLSCARTVLSDARNWYVPARLTPDMNRQLDETRMPFGRVVAPLQFRREPITAHAPAPCPAGTILQRTAVLRRLDGQAISVVSECYTRANIAAHRDAA